MASASKTTELLLSSIAATTSAEMRPVIEDMEYEVMRLNEAAQLAANELEVAKSMRHDFHVKFAELGRKEDEALYVDSKGPV